MYLPFIKKNNLAKFLFLVICLQMTLAKRTYTDEDLDTWEPPAKLKEVFTYYLAGPDYDGQPVFVIEYGKWPVRRVIEEGDEKIILQMEKYAEQMLYKFSKSVGIFKNESTSFVTIVDLDGYNAKEVSHIQSLNFVLKGILQRFQNDFAKDLDYSYTINVNYVAQTVLDTLVRPILSDTFSKIEIYGTNKDKWIPKLLRKIPKESLPPWYGGAQNFKPVAVFGR